MAMEGFLTCPAALQVPMTAAQCYDMAARSCQTPRVVQRMPARTLQEGIQSGGWHFINGKLLVKRDFVDVDTTLYVPAGAEVARMISVKRKQQIDVAYVNELSANELVEVSFLNPPGAYGGPYCTRCASWSLGIQHADHGHPSQIGVTHRQASLQQLGTCSFCEEQCSDVRERNDAWHYLFTVEVERLEVQIEAKVEPLLGPPACAHAKALISEDRCKIMSSQWAQMAEDCRKAWCSVDTCNYGFQVPPNIDCNNEAVTTITTTSAESLREESRPRAESPRKQRLRKSEEANEDIRLYFVYVIGSAAGALTLCSCLLGICSLLKSVDEERNLDRLSRSESREPSALKRHVEQARLVAPFVPAFVRSKSGRHVAKKAKQMPLDPIVAAHCHITAICVDDLQVKKEAIKAAWDDDDASTYVSSQAGGSRRPSWQSDCNSGIEVQHSCPQPSSTQSVAGSRRPSWQSDSKPDVVSKTSFKQSAERREWAWALSPSWQSEFKTGLQGPGEFIASYSQTSSGHSGAGSRRPSCQSDSNTGARQSSLQPSHAGAGAGSRRPSWQSDSNPGVRQSSHAGSRRPSWQSDFSSGASNPVPSARPSPQPGVFSAAALRTVGSGLRSSLRNGQ